MAVASYSGLCLFVEELISLVGLADDASIVDLTSHQVTVNTLTEARINCTTEQKVIFYGNPCPIGRPVSTLSVGCISILLLIHLSWPCSCIPEHHRCPEAIILDIKTAPAGDTLLACRHATKTETKKSRPVSPKIKHTMRDCVKYMYWMIGCTAGLWLIVNQCC